MGYNELQTVTIRGIIFLVLSVYFTQIQGRGIVNPETVFHVSSKDNTTTTLGYLICSQSYENSALCYIYFVLEINYIEIVEKVARTFYY